MTLHIARALQIIRIWMEPVKYKNLTETEAYL